jgi:sugar lactone lactonase YvrE
MSSPDIQHWSTGAPWIDLHCKLGEGPYYERATNTLRFVDIIKKQLHTVSLAAGPDSLSTQTFDEAIAVTADIEGVDPQEKILVGVKQGIAVLDRKSGKYEYISKYADAGAGSERIRSNDGAVDPHGRFWLGSMTDFPYGNPTDEGEFPLLLPLEVYRELRVPEPEFRGDCGCLNGLGNLHEVLRWCNRLWPGLSVDQHFG